MILRKLTLLALLAFLALLALPVLTMAQTVSSGLSRDTIRVGDPFRAVLKIAVPPGTDLVLPDSITPTEDVENAGRVRSRRDSTSAGVSVIAAYPLTAWRPGRLALPDLPVVLKTGNAQRTMNVKLPVIPVVSVLPADTTNIQARPPKDVVGPNWPWWLWLLLALALLLLAGLAYWWWRRRHRVVAEPEIIPLIMPRERALQELERIRALGLIEEGAYKRFYSLVSEVLRQYLQTVDRAWGTDLTTHELSRKLRSTSEVQAVLTVLRNADMVKFAKHTPSADDATHDLERAREFVTNYPAPPVVAPSEAAA